MAIGALPRWRVWLIPGLLLLTLALRVYQLDGQSLWADEGNSAALAGRPFAAIAQAAAMDIHPPLYYFLLRTWTLAFGSSEIGLRSLSVMLGLALAAVTGWLGRQWAGESGAAAALLLAATSPLQVYYAQEARMYVLLALLATLTVAAAWRLAAVETGRRGARAVWPALCFVGAAAAGLYTHYFFPVMWAAANAGYGLSWTLRRGDGRKWSHLGRWVGLQALVLLLYLPWLWTGIDRLLHWPAGGANLDALAWWNAAWRTLCLGPAAPGPLLVTFPFGVLLLAGIWQWPSLRQVKAGSDVSCWFAALGFGTPLLVMATLGLFSESRLKFLLVASPFMMLIMARGVAGLARVGSGHASLAWRVICRAVVGAALAAVILLSGVALHNYYEDSRAERDDYRGMAAYISAVARPEDAIILNAPGQWDVFSYYYRGNWPVYRLPQQRPPMRDQLEVRLARIAAEHKRLYVLYWALDESDPEGVMETWLDRYAYKGVDAWNGNVRFVVYETAAGQEDRLVEDDLNLTFGANMQLLASARPQEPVAAGDILPMVLTWQVLSPPAGHLHVFLQALDAGNHVVGQRDAPLGGGVASIAAGQTIIDRHGLLIEPGTPPGECRLIGGLYDPESGQRLIVQQTGQDVADLGLLQVEKPAVAMPARALNPTHDARKAIGPLAFLGYDRHELGQSRDSTDSLAPGSILHLTCYWQAIEQPEGEWDYRIRLGEHLLLDWAPIGGAYATLRWDADDLVRDQVDRFLPPDMPAGAHRLRLDVRAPDSERLAATWSLGTVRIR